MRNCDEEVRDLVTGVPFINVQIAEALEFDYRLIQHTVCTQGGKLHARHPFRRSCFGNTPEA